VKYVIIEKNKEENAMVVIAVKCPVCQGIDISKNGKTKQEVQRYICNEKTCSGKSFLLEYTYNGAKPGIEGDIINMTANASGISDISRVLKVSETKVSQTLKNGKSHKQSQSEILRQDKCCRRLRGGNNVGRTRQIGGSGA
jgi:transposase-like protein